MAIASSIDVVLENDDIVVLGPPTSIDIAVDIGPQGPRGSRTFTGGVDPNTYSSAQFETIYGYVPVYGDIFIRTSSGSDYGIFYMYNTLAPGGPIWQQTLKIYDLLTDFFTLNDTFVLSGKNGGTGAANTGKSLLLGGPQTIFNGNYTVTISSTGNTNITLPTSGTLATTGNLSQFASTTSAQLAGIISDETGSGLLVFNNSPTLTGTPLSTTAAADTNTTQLATTAFVIGQAGSASPLMDNTATVGTSLRYARQDHIHPTDTSRAPLASPTFTGTPAGPTAAVDTNTTQLASTAFVLGQASSTNPTSLGSVAIGTSTRYARADHVHPTTGLGLTSGTLAQFAATTSSQLAGVISDETGSGSLVFSASPAFTGIPTAPTAAVDTNTTQLATTAFVLGQASGTNPTALGSVAIGTSTRYARSDHVHPTTGLALLSGATFTGSIITPASTTSLSPLNIPHGSNPTTPTNGDIWTTTSGMYVRINGSTIGPLGTGGGGGGGGTTNTEDVIGISFFTMGA